MALCVNFVTSPKEKGPRLGPFRRVVDAQPRKACLFFASQLVNGVLSLLVSFL